MPPRNSRDMHILLFCCDSARKSVKLLMGFPSIRDVGHSVMKWISITWNLWHCILIRRKLSAIFNCKLRHEFVQFQQKTFALFVASVLFLYERGHRRRLQKLTIKIFHFRMKNSFAEKFWRIFRKLANRYKRIREEMLIYITSIRNWSCFYRGHKKFTRKSRNTLRNV